MDPLFFEDRLKMKLLMFDGFLSHVNKDAIELIEFLYSDSSENKLDKEIREAWKQLYYWANKINGTICDDCITELTLSTSEEAENLLRQIGPKTTGDENVVWATRLLIKSFKYWGKSDC